MRTSSQTTMLAPPLSIELGNIVKTMTDAPSPAEMDLAIDFGRRSHRAAPRQSRRQALRRPIPVVVTVEHHRSPEIAGKPSGSRKKPCARFLKRTGSSQ